MPAPLRTLLFSTLYPSASRPVHGIFVETRLRELLKSGAVETRVVAPVPWFWSTDPRHGERARIASTPPRERRHGIDVLHPRYALLPKVGMTVAPLPLALAALPSARRLLAEGFDFDLIDAHYYYPDGVAAALLAGWLGKPLAITARGTDLNLIAGYRLPRAMMRWAAARAAASIGVCEALVDVLRGWGVPPAKLHVMRNGVDLERFRPTARSAARSALGLAGEPILLSVGHLIERKGHDLVIDALARLRARHPSVRLVIVGEGPEREALQRRAAAAGVTAEVTFAGAVPNEELGRWYSAADVSILASSREGWANVLLESMACGTPVAATDVGGTAEVVCTPAAGRLVAQRDVPSIVSAVDALLASPPARAAVRAHAERFGWEAISRAQVELFARLAARPCPAPDAPGRAAAAVVSETGCTPPARERTTAADDVLRLR